MRLIVLILSGFLCCSCTKVQKQPVSYSHKLDTLSNGFLRGYLKDSIAVRSILNPPPELSTELGQIDSMETMRFYLMDSIRKAQAVSDAKLSTASFEEITGLPLSMEETPHAYVIMQRVISDVIFYSAQAKYEFKRTRPYNQLEISSCWPEKESKTSYSYPSGHAMIGQSWAAIFSSLFPEHRDALIARGEDYALSRVVCGVHWYYDILAAKSLSGKLISDLLADEQFKHDLDSAQEEIARLKMR